MMFGGHNDDKSDENKDDNSDNQEHAPVINSNAVPDQPADNTVADDDAPAVSDDAAWQHPGTPLETESTKINDVISPVGGYPRSTSTQSTSLNEHADAPSNDSDDLGDSSLNDLVN